MIIALYLITPLIFALLTLLIRKNFLWHRILSLVSSIIHLSISLYLFIPISTNDIVIEKVGNWGIFGVVLAIDRFSHIMLLTTSLIFVIFYIYNLSGLPKDYPYEKRNFYPFTLTLLTSLTGIFSTGDLFNMYVWFEILLISSFVLMILGDKKKRYSGALKYVIINLISSTFFLTALGLLYGKTGTLNIADLAFKLQNHEHVSLILSSAMLMGITFSIKSGIFPFYSWLPDSYHLPTPTITTLFGGLLTKVGIYALMRSFILFFHNDAKYFTTIFTVSAIFTMTTGVWGAASKMDMKKILSFHIISQVGYLILSVAIFTQNAFSAAIFFMIHIIFTKTGLFLTSNYIEDKYHSDNILTNGQLFTNEKFIAITFMIFALSIAGLPPFSGFFSKIWILEVSLQANHLVSFFTALIVSFFTLYSMMKIWRYAYLSKPEIPKGQCSSSYDQPWNKKFAITICTILVVGMGIFYQPISEYVSLTGRDLFDYNLYINKVLKE